MLQLPELAACWAMPIRLARALASAVTLLTALHLTGCTTAPRSAQVPLDTTGIQRQLITGDPFRHVLFRRGTIQPGRPVHVYLEGDGRPWATRYRISADPTPHRPLALHLMSRDPEPSLLLGRPCYYGLAEDPGCNSDLWTYARYGEAVVTSMAAALDAALAGSDHGPIRLIGYSGGAVLAMLLAERFTGVEAVVTVAGNLDIDAWTRRHDYTPLMRSLNPAERPPLPPTIRQLHLAGARDRNVPPRLIRAAIARQPGARLRVVDGFDHRCCWVERWPGLVDSPDRAEP